MYYASDFVAAPAAATPAAAPATPAPAAGTNTTRQLQGSGMGSGWGSDPYYTPEFEQMECLCQAEFTSEFHEMHDMMDFAGMTGPEIDMAEEMLWEMMPEMHHEYEHDDHGKVEHMGAVLDVLKDTMQSGRHYCHVHRALYVNDDDANHATGYGHRKLLGWTTHRYLKRQPSDKGRKLYGMGSDMDYWYDPYDTGMDGMGSDMEMYSDPCSDEDKAAEHQADLVVDALMDMDIDQFSNFHDGMMAHTVDHMAEQDALMNGAGGVKQNGFQYCDMDGASMGDMGAHNPMARALRMTRFLHRSQNIRLLKVVSEKGEERKLEEISGERKQRRLAEGEYISEPSERHRYLANCDDNGICMHDYTATMAIASPDEMHCMADQYMLEPEQVHDLCNHASGRQAHHAEAGMEMIRRLLASHEVQDSVTGRRLKTINEVRALMGDYDMMPGHYEFDDFPEGVSDGCVITEGDVFSYMNPHEDQEMLAHNPLAAHEYEMGNPDYWTMPHFDMYEYQYDHDPSFASMMDAHDAAYDMEYEATYGSPPWTTCGPLRPRR
jgi:hypothetical protein